MPAYQCAGGSTGDRIYWNFIFFQRPQHADMRNATAGAAGKSDADAGTIASL